MPPSTTPEAESRNPEGTSGGGHHNEGSSKNDRKPKGDDKTNPKNKSPEDKNPEQEKSRENDKPSPPEKQKVESHIWDVTYNKVRHPINTIFQVGMFTAMPVPYVAVRSANAILKRTPLVKNVYNPAKENLVMRPARVTGDIATGILTSPAAIPDAAVDIYQGATEKMPTINARSKIGRVRELLFEGIGKLFTKISEALPTAREKLKRGGKFAGSVIAAPFKFAVAVENGIDQVAKNIPVVKWLGPGTHVISTLLTLKGIQYAGLYGLPYVSETAAQWFGTLNEWLLGLANHII
ncbi:MAG: hypothetical protein WCS85_03790 [Candidatus Peribacteraceae bacterium]